jgi:alpha-1,3-rhamnosyl/mannosyltransferase
MRIAFNATALLSPLTGIGQYSRQIATGLTSSPGIEPAFFYGATWSREVRPEPLPGAGRILPWLRNNIPFAYALRRIAQSQQFTRYAKPARFDLYHEPNILPLPFDGPTVITVHDLSWIRHPEAHPKERVRAMNRYFPAGLARANGILTDSIFVKKELITLFGVPAEKIKVIPLGVESLFRPLSADQTQTVLQRFGLIHGHYFLAVGTLEPRKNLPVALDAYARLPSTLRQHFPLVLAGMKGWHSTSLEHRIDTLSRAGEIRLPGYLPRTDLAQLIAGATALVFPSIYEGFGLPPLEAMACGVPVISSNAAAMPEVIGETGILLDPQDVDGMTQAMLWLANTPSDRSRLGGQAQERSKYFSWQACVEKTISAYQQTLSSSLQQPGPS